MTLPNGEPLRWDMGPEFVWGGDVPASLYPTRHMPQIRVSLGFAQAADNVIEETAAEVFTGMTGNAAYPTPPVTLASLQTANNTFATSRVAAASGGPAQTAAKETARDEVVRLLRILASYVQEKCGNDLAKLLSSGFEAVSTNRASVPLQKPNIATVENAGAGKLKLRLGSVANARNYEVRYGAAPGVWIATVIFNSTRDMILTGLTAGTVYTIEACALGGSTGASEWSDPVSHMSI